MITRLNAQAAVFPLERRYSRFFLVRALVYSVTAASAAIIATSGIAVEAVTAAVGMASNVAESAGMMRSSAMPAAAMSMIMESVMAATIIAIGASMMMMMIPPMGIARGRMPIFVLRIVN
ncbi:hypothetical protein [Paenibacillus zanthoxyli]|uniref:hypothetical protein n=1 Tax=Paenibacillus zanthoxyli TaxID=369399 RepID=UPI00047029C5|nr:hypothetical protein [Paenibacillus zanthoxyli]